MGWDEVMNGIAIDLQREVTEAAPFRTGTLRNSIKAHVTGDDEITLEMVGYGRYVEYGTPPHLITAKKAKALHWKEGRKDVFAKSVQHPGTRPNPFIRSTVHRQLEPIVQRNIALHMGE